MSDKPLSTNHFHPNLISDFNQIDVEIVKGREGADIRPSLSSAGNKGFAGTQTEEEDTMDEIMALQEARELLEKRQYEAWSEYGNSAIWRMVLHARDYVDNQLNEVLHRA